MAEEILFEKQGEIGLVTLNRPKALNALNEGMCLAHLATLNDWAEDDEVKAVVVRGEGDKAFCAGGDVISLYKSGKAWRDGDEGSLAWRDFFHAEYRMNNRVHSFPKPYISLIDGITMGGGVGISVHGSNCIATDKTVFAMPETGLGLIPDVGGGWFMPRLPDSMGMYLALTGDRIKAPDLVKLGICSHYVPSDRLNDLVTALTKEAGDVNTVIEKFAEDPGEPKLKEQADTIEEIFKEDSVENILAALKKKENEWAQKWHKRLLTKSPTSMKVTFRQLREGMNKRNFEENMQMEFRIVNHIMEGNDFYEGVRAILLDKDNEPKWDPAKLEDVTDDMVQKHFESLGSQELHFE